MSFRHSRFAAVFLFLSIASSALPGPANDPIRLLADQEHWKQARSRAEERLRLNSDDAAAFYWMSRSQENFNNLEAAVAYAEKAVALNGDDADYHAQLAETYALMAEKATVLKQLALVHKMHKELQAALSLNNRQVDALLVRMMFEWKAPHVVGGSREKALQTAQQILGIDAAWGYLAQAKLYQDEDPAKMQAFLEKAVATQPALYRAKATLADFYCSHKPESHLNDAERLAKSVVQQDPAQAQGYSVLAKVYARQGRWNDLDNTLIAAAKNVPDDLSPYYYAAKILVGMGQDASRAERYLQRYVSQPPEARAPGLSDARILLAQAARPRTVRSAQALAPNRKASPGSE